MSDFQMPALWYNYRYTFTETGIAIKKKYPLGRSNNLSIGLSTSYINGYLKTGRKEQKIIVLIPAYINDTTLTLADFHGVSIILDLKHQVTLRNFTLTTSINQLVPFWLEKRNKGGTVYSCALTYRFL